MQHELRPNLEIPEDAVPAPISFRRVQADVDIHRGNSGGPLLDQNGNIIGLAVAGYVRGGQDLAGLYLFIPIADALEKLNIVISEINLTSELTSTKPPKTLINPQ